jgi:hypothetical protein
MDVLYTTPGWQDYELNLMIAHDTTLCMYALAFVGVCLLAHTFSVFLTLMAILNVALAFPLALICFRVRCPLLEQNVAPEEGHWEARWC